jgi:hypothetical protein
VVEFGAGTTDIEGMYRPQSWSEWYAFARETLEYGTDEAIAYANLRHVEDVNRAHDGAQDALGIVDGPPAELPER